MRSFRFMDESLMLSKINKRNSDYIQTAPKQPQEKHDLLTQNVFRCVVDRASGRGMVVNNKKTNVLCMSDANTYRAAAFIVDGDGSRQPAAVASQAEGPGIPHGLSSYGPCACEGSALENKGKDMDLATPETE